MFSHLAMQGSYSSTAEASADGSYVSASSMPGFCAQNQGKRAWQLFLSVTSAQQWAAR